MPIAVLYTDPISCENPHSDIPLLCVDCVAIDNAASGCRCWRGGL